MATRQGPRAGRWGTLLLVVVGLSLMVTGVVGWWTQSPEDGPVATDPTPSRSMSPPAPQPVVEPEPLPRAKRAEWRPGAPRSLEVPALSIEAPIVPIAAPGGVLTPPADPQTLGWWVDGAKPGARRGSALVTGHTVHDGGGAMDDLEQLRAGDRVWMRTDRGRIGYQVKDVVVLGKGELAERAERLFDQEVRGRLVLITCEDWNGAEYLSNVVVTATPV